MAAPISRREPVFVRTSSSPCATVSAREFSKGTMMDDKKHTSGLSLEAVTDWWESEITDIAPGSIRVRGYRIEELIGRVGFSSMIWLVLRGELPSQRQADLFGAVLVAGVDHGPQAPSISIARMAITCGIGINGAIASGVNALGDGDGA